MRDFVYENFTHVLCALLLLAKLGDNISTRLITPTLKLEANPLARKLKWGFIWLTLAICLLPYYSTTLAVMALTVFLMISASNFGRVWQARVLGEDEIDRLSLVIARRSSLGQALWPRVVSALYVSAVGGLLIFLEYPGDNWGFWVGMGIILYAAVILGYGALALTRLFRRARAEPS